ncbi:MAG: hypothetical protein WDN01_11560 [Rhizomicrobium sp.]
MARWKQEETVEAQLELLLRSLCDDWGFNLSDAKVRAIVTAKRIDARQFALDVLKADGYEDPEDEIRWIRRIKRRFVQHFGQLVVEQ